MRKKTIDKSNTFFFILLIELTEFCVVFISQTTEINKYM